MAIPKFESDMDIISKLGNYPRVDNGLSPDGFKGKFDIAGRLIKDYINNVLIPQLDMLVDVQALLDGILDTSLSKADKAAAAKAVGDGLRKMAAERRMDAAKIFEKVVRGGDYVINSGSNFSASITGANTVRVNSGAYVAQGNLVELNAADGEHHHRHPHRRRDADRRSDCQRQDAG
ncbi:MAG: hypothetical protein ACI3V5_08315, partial [Faecousia sp.]